MGLPDSYVLKPGSIPAYFEAILNAQPPERFSIRFLVNLEFKSTNDRLIIGVLKDLGFITSDGVPTSRYFQFLDRSQAPRVVAEGVREAYADLFAINTKAHELTTDEVKNKLRTLYAGAKKDDLIARIARTFTALCEYADFSDPPRQVREAATAEPTSPPPTKKAKAAPKKVEDPDEKKTKSVSLDSLQYHINIVLPESRDQAVYDAIFKSLRDHLG